jgi:hypothetical protein
VLFTHAPAHTVCPVGHTHWPDTHSPPVGHARPHMPQLFGSLAVLAQPFAHWTSGDVHTTAVHTPLTHVDPAPHAWPQVPQLFGSSVMFTHAPAHTDNPGGHTQTPEKHSLPVAHA